MAKPSTNPKPAKSEPQLELFDEFLPEQALWQQFQRIGGDITPALVSAILRDADAGQPARFVDLTHEFRQKSAHFQSVAETREKAVSELPWSLTLPEGARKREQKAAKRLEDALREAGAPDGSGGFVEAVEHLVGEPILFGHGHVEAIWKIDDEGWLVPARFQRVSCRRFGFRQKDGALLFDAAGLGSSVDQTGVDLSTFAAGKFINVRRRINGDVLIREGLARLMVWLSAFATWDQKDWLAFAEMAWKPARRAKYKRGIQKEERQNLARKLSQWISTGVLIHPDDIDIDLEWPPARGGGQSSHKELADHLAEEMSKAYLGGTLMVQAGNRGARSLGETQDKLRLSRRDGDVLAVAASLTHQLARPFMQMNLGPRAAPLTFTMQTDEGVDQKAFAEAIEIYGRAGLAVPAAYVYDQSGIPQPKEGEAILKPLAIAPQPTTTDKPKAKAKKSDDDAEEDADE